MKKKIALFLVLAMMLTLTACGGGTTNTPSSPDADAAPDADASSESGASEGFDGKIVIGSLAAQTGSNAAVGDMMVKSFQMAVDEVNAAGGIAGKEIEMEIIDSSDDVDSAVNAANILLADEDVVAVIGPQMSGQVFGIEELVRGSDIPFLVGGTNPGIPALENPNIYGIRTNDSVNALAAIQFLTSNDFGTPVTKVAIMCCTNDFGAGGQQVAVDYLDQIGMDYVIEPHNYDTTDMSASILKVRNEGCDAIFTWTEGSLLPILARQIYEAGFEVPTIGNTIDQATVDTCEPEWLEGYYCTTDFYIDSEDPVSADFTAKFRETYGTDPTNIAACYYSGITLLLDAMKRCEDPTDRAQVAQAIMETKDFIGPTGTFTAQADHQLIAGANILVRSLDKYEFVKFVSAE